MNELLAGIYGLLSALSWGSGDFTGGLATKKNSTFTVVIISQLFGAILILALVFGAAEGFPGWADMGWGALAGAAGAFGLLVFYRALSAGKMGLVAPFTALISVFVTVLIGFFLEGAPSSRQVAGILLALGAVWLVSKPEGDRAASWSAIFKREFWLPPLAAGLGFGFFFVLIDRVQTGAVFWPLVAARSVSFSMLLAAGLVLRRITKPAPGSFGLIILAGMLDVGGNIFFVLAAQTGRLDISAVLASFFSAVTVFWAWVILKERLSTSQMVGVVGVILSIVLITA